MEWALVILEVCSADLIQTLTQVAPNTPRTMDIGEIIERTKHMITGLWTDLQVAQKEKDDWQAERARWQAEKAALQSQVLAARASPRTEVMQVTPTPPSPAPHLPPVPISQSNVPSEWERRYGAPFTTTTSSGLQQTQTSTTVHSSGLENSPYIPVTSFISCSAPTTGQEPLCHGLSQAQSSHHTHPPCSMESRAMGSPQDIPARAQSQTPGNYHSSGHPHSSRPKIFKEVTPLNLGDTKLTPYLLDAWLGNFCFIMADECPGLTPEAQARALVHNTEENFNKEKLREFIQAAHPTLDQVVAWIKSDMLRPPDRFGAERAAVGIIWKQGEETITEYRDRLLRLMKEASETSILTASDMTRASDRFFQGLPSACRFFLLDKDVPRELTAQHAAVCKWVDRQLYMQYSEAARANSMQYRTQEKPREAPRLVPSSWVSRGSGRGSTQFTHPSTLPSSGTDGWFAHPEERVEQGSPTLSPEAQQSRTPRPRGSMLSQDDRNPSQARSPSRALSSSSPLICSGCQESGHRRSQCPYWGFNCHKCGREGHQRQHCITVTAVRRKSRASLSQHVHPNQEHEYEDLGSRGLPYTAPVGEELPYRAEEAQGYDSEEDESQEGHGEDESQGCDSKEDEPQEEAYIYMMDVQSLDSPQLVTPLLSQECEDHSLDFHSAASHPRLSPVGSRRTLVFRLCWMGRDGKLLIIRETPSMWGP